VFVNSPNKGSDNENSRPEMKWFRKRFSISEDFSNLSGKAGVNRKALETLAETRTGHGNTLTMGPRGALDTVAKRKMSRHCPSQEVNPNRSVTILTELPRLP
jgi:hypothetical protein